MGCRKNMNAQNDKTPWHKRHMRIFASILWLMILASPALGFDWSPSHHDNENDKSVGVKVEAFSDQEVLRPDDRFELNLVVSLDEGWHIYSLESQDDPTLPTRIVLKTHLAEVGEDWKESTPTIVKDQILNRMVKVHLERAEFKRTYVVPSDLGPGHHPVRGVLTFRACDNRVCTMPRKVRFNTLIQIVAKDQV